MRNLTDSFISSISGRSSSPRQLIEIEYLDVYSIPRVKRYAINEDDITFGDPPYVYYKNLKINIGEYSIGPKEYPNVQFSWVDIDRDFRNEFNTAKKILEYPDIRGAIVKIHQVNLDDLTSSIWDEFIINQCTANSGVITFECGTFLDSPNFNMTRYNYTRRACQAVYKDALTCGYTGSAGPCPKTIEACRERKNSARFFAYPLVVDEELAQGNGI